MNADELFEGVVGALEDEPGVTAGRMFGSPGLKVGGKAFAMLVKERLVVKLPEVRVDEIQASVSSCARPRLRPSPTRARTGRTAPRR